MTATPAREIEARRRRALTAQERVVMRIAATGAANKEIAAELGIGGTTVSTHITHILEKLDATNKVEALRKLGWIVLPDEVEEELADRLLIFAATAAQLRVELDAIDVRIDSLDVEA